MSHSRMDQQTHAESSIKRRTGGRSARIKQTVLEQALIELIEVGYIDFTISNVAVRANVHETTIYRRWNTREALVMDAISTFANNQLPLPNFGNLAEDLAHNIRAISQLIQSPIGTALIHLAFSAQTDHNIRELNLKLWNERIEFGQRIFEVAMTRGEWPKHYDQHLVFSEVIGPLISHYFLLQQPITEQFIQQRVKMILSQVEHFKIESRV